MLRRLENSDLYLPPVDAIVVQGSGLHRNHAIKRDKAGNEISRREIGRRGWLPLFPDLPKPKSSADEIMRIIATGHLWERYKDLGTELIVFTTGGNSYPDLAPSIAAVAKDDLVRRFKIPEELIIPAARGRNTVANIEEIKETIHLCGFSRLAYVSNEYHLVAKALARQEGWIFMGAEDLLIGRNEKYRGIIEDIRRSPTTAALRASQMKGLLMVNMPLVGRGLYKLYSELTLPGRATVTDFDPHVWQKQTGKYREVAQLA